MARIRFNFRKSFNRTELFDFIDSFSVEKVGSNLVTMRNGNVIKTVTISNRYEIFDFKKYLKEKIDAISKNFNISEYSTYFTGGIQEIRLYSDKVEINDDVYEKCFFFLNSTDKTRVLNMDLGFHNKTRNVYCAFSKSEFSLRKKHLTGITEAANTVSMKLDDNTFESEIESIKSLIGSSVALSKIQETLLASERDTDEPIKSGHLRFESFMYLLRNRRKSNYKDSVLKMGSAQLQKAFETKDANKYDFYVDAYEAFVIYTSIFGNRDSYVVAKETERILKITQNMIRNNKLEELFA